MIDTVDAISGIEATERIEMVVLISSLEDERLVVDLAQPLRVHKRRPCQYNCVIQAVVLGDYNPEI